MAKYEIKVVTSGAKQAADEFEKLGNKSEQTKKKLEDTGKSVDQLTGKQRKMVDGLKALGQELPIIGTLINTVKNPFILLGTIGVTAFVAISKAVDEARGSIERYNSYAGNVKVSLSAYQDVTAAIKQLTEAQKALADQAESTNTFLQGQVDLLAENANQGIRVLEAEKELAAARIEKEVADPVERARKLKENDLKFGMSILGVRGSLPGQQAELIKQQIAAEKQLQVDAGNEVPNEQGLRSAVRGVQADRSALESARVDNRRKSQRAALFERVAGLSPEESIWTALDSGQLAQLQQEVDFSSISKPSQFVDRAKELLPGAQAQSTIARERVSRLSSSLRAGIGALPAGAVRFGILEDEGRIPDFINQAEGEAAGTQNASYRRETTMAAKVNQLNRQQAGEVAVSKIGVQTVGIRGDIAIEQAVRQALAEQAKAFAEALRENAREIQHAKRAIQTQSQNSQ